MFTFKHRSRRLSLPLNLQKTARHTGLVRRHSPKFDPGSFLASVLRSTVSGESSFNHIAMSLGTSTGRPMSRQAVHKRFSARSTEFLLAILGDLRTHSSRACRLSGRGEPATFRRAIVEDSTVHTVGKPNAQHFPGNGNCHGATGGAKLDFTYDLVSGEVCAAEVTDARTPDQKRGRHAPLGCRAGDLVLRDMGYFCLEGLAEIDLAGASWISRLPATTTMHLGDGTPLLKLLRSVRGNRIDQQVFVGESRYPCRLVASRLSRKDTAKNRRNRRRESKRHGCKPSPEGLARDAWRLLITSVPRKALGASSVHQLYSLRWDAEITFRAIKQACQLERAVSHRTNLHHLQALVLGSAIYATLLRIADSFFSRAIGGRETSLERLSDAFASLLTRLTPTPNRLLFEPDPRHICREKRKRVSMRALTRQLLG